MNLTHYSVDFDLVCYAEITPGSPHSLVCSWMTAKLRLVHRWLVKGISSSWLARSKDDKELEVWVVVLFVVCLFFLTEIRMRQC